MPKLNPSRADPKSLCGTSHPHTPQPPPPDPPASLWEPEALEMKGMSLVETVAVLERTLALGPSRLQGLARLFFPARDFSQATG